MGWEWDGGGRSVAVSGAASLNALPRLATGRLESGLPSSPPNKSEMAESSLSALLASSVAPSLAGMGGLWLGGF